MPPGETRPEVAGSGDTATSSGEGVPMGERAEDDDGPRGIRVSPAPDAAPGDAHTIAWVVVAISVGGFLFAAVVTVLSALGGRS